MYTLYFLKSTSQNFAEALIIDRYLELVNNSCKVMEIFCSLHIALIMWVLDTGVGSHLPLG